MCSRSALHPRSLARRPEPRRPAPPPGGPSARWRLRSKGSHPAGWSARRHGGSVPCRRLRRRQGFYTVSSSPPRREPSGRRPPAEEGSGPPGPPDGSGPGKSRFPHGTLWGIGICCGNAPGFSPPKSHPPGCPNLQCGSARLERVAVWPAVLPYRRDGGSHSRRICRNRGSPEGHAPGRSVNLHEFPQGVGFHDPRDSQVNPLPPDGPGHEDHGAVQPDDAIALAGIAFHQSGVDLAAFQVFHRSGAYASHFSSSCRSSAAYLARDLLSRPLLRLMNSVSILPTEARRS